jgi:hypothetical protein
MLFGGAEMGSKYNLERLAPIVLVSQSMVEVLRALGLRPTGGNYRHLNVRIRALDISTAHFTGSAWSRGKTKETSENVWRITQKITLPDEQVFVENCPFSIKGPRLIKRI